MMKHLLAPAAAAALLLCSCVTQTPQTRIADSPLAFGALKPEHQELVSRGMISKGMPKTGVLLALGRPDREITGHRDGAHFERWDFTSLRPYYSGSFFGSYYGGHGYHHGGYGLGYAPSVQYVPERDASVWFRGEKVHSWDRVTSPYGY